MSVILLVVLFCGCAMAQRNTNKDFLFEDRSYFVVDAVSSWPEAIKSCQRRGATLAVVNSAAEARDVKKIMLAYNLAAVHVGFHDSFTEGDYVTVNGDTLLQNYGQVTAWAPGSPRGALFNCGGFTLAGFMDVNCSSVRPYICGEMARSSGDCNHLPGLGYEYIRGYGYYKHYQVNQTWIQAERRCRQDGAHLVVLNSAVEANLLFTKYTAVTELYTWVGVHRFLGGDYDFITLQGGMYNTSGYVRWIEKQPAGNYLTAPVALYRQSNKLTGFAAADKTTTSQYICEQNIKV